jgi:RHS repeat-associated protein
MKGTYGMQAVLDDTSAIYITDDTPNAEPRYRARFYFDPNSLTMANNDAHFIFKGFSGASTDVFQVEFRYSSGNYELRARVLNDASAWTNTNWFTLSDASHYIELDWRAATGSGTNDGGLTLWIDGTQQADLTGIDNDTWRVDRARLGALSSLDAGTSGTYYFDAFESRRSNYIGPMAFAPSVHFASYRFNPLQQSGSLSFNPVDDASIRSASPTNNYGSDTTLEVDNSPIKHFLLKFDVTGINGGQVTNAKLCLYNVGGANEGGDFYHVSNDSWQEETVTWNNAPAAEGDPLASLGDVNPDTWYELNLTSHITADGTYSLRVSDSVGGADYSSKEGSNAPKLLVAVGGATPQSCTSTATATPTATPSPTNTPGPSPTPTNTLPPTATFTPGSTPIFSNAAFTYDGDGKRVKSVITTNVGTTTTYFVGTHYEVADGIVTNYYHAGTQRIAMRTNGTLNFLLGDHLGSTSLTTDANGQIISELRYTAWGEIRYTSGSIPTKYQYTGQYSYAGEFGLIYYGARWYDSSLGRFAQTDTIVPPLQGVQGWDRYAYTNNNPLRYIDPTGHIIDDGCRIGCGGGNPVPLPSPNNGGGGGGGGGNGGGSGGGGGGSDYCSTLPWLCGGSGGPSGGGDSTGLNNDEQDDGHYYQTENVVCPAVFNCVEEEIQEYITMFQYPGQLPWNPVGDLETNFVFPAPLLAWYFGNPLLLLTGAIYTDISDDGLSATNYTYFTHIFHEGLVDREYSQNADGSWTVTTTGTGTNVWPVVGPYIDQANETVGVYAFNAVDTTMLIYITADQLSGALIERASDFFP